MFENNKLFEKVYAEGGVNVTEIWRDTRTGVHYLFHCCGNAGGLTPLLGPDGKPLITNMTQDSTY